MTKRDMPGFEELSDQEIAAIIRAQTLASSRSVLLALWRVFGLPESHLVEQHVNGSIGHPGENREQP